MLQVTIEAKDSCLSLPSACLSCALAHLGLVKALLEVSNLVLQLVQLLVVLLLGGTDFLAQCLRCRLGLFYLTLQLFVLGLESRNRSAIGASTSPAASTGRRRWCWWRHSASRRRPVRSEETSQALAFNRRG